MKVCIPSLDDGGVSAPVSPHFGRAPYYAVYDTTEDDLDVIANESNHQGGSRSPPDFIADIGADVLVCGNLGNKAIERFDSMDIDVYCGAEGTIRDAIDQWESDRLDPAVPGTDGCGHGHGPGGHSGH